MAVKKRGKRNSSDEKMTSLLGNEPKSEDLPETSAEELVAEEQTGDQTKTKKRKKKKNLKPITTTLLILILLVMIGGTIWFVMQRAKDSVLFKPEMTENEEPLQVAGNGTDMTAPSLEDEDVTQELVEETVDEKPAGYELCDDIRDDLSYSIRFETYEYEKAPDNAAIKIIYPVVEGDQVPNLDNINEHLRGEIEYFVNGYETGFDKLMVEDGYFNNYVAAYVTYMDEDLLSVVFSEYIGSDFYDYYKLYTVNIDMNGGIMLDNTSLVDPTDEFLDDFLARNQAENGNVNEVEQMDRSTLRNAFKTDDLIYFYTPNGREIGINFSNGWVIVPYEGMED